jgi:hypothetical protein
MNEAFGYIERKLETKDIVKQNMRLDLLLFFRQKSYRITHSIRILKKFIGFNPLFERLL